MVEYILMWMCVPLMVLFVMLGAICVIVAMMIVRDIIDERRDH